MFALATGNLSFDAWINTSNVCAKYVSVRREILYETAGFRSFVKNWQRTP